MRGSGDTSSRSDRLGQEGEQDGVARLGDYAGVVGRHWRLIGIICVLAVAATAGWTSMQPKIYEATATLLAPREGGSNMMLGNLAAAGLLQQVPGLGLSFPSLSPNRDMMLSILKSRTMAQTVVKRFGLMERYKSRYPEDAIRTLGNRRNIQVSKEGVISIRVEDVDPAVAAAAADFHVEELDRLIGRYGTGEAGRQRTFLTEQLVRAKTDLEAAEESLRRFQERNRAVALQDQTKGAIEGAARLQGEIMAVEVQLQVMRNFATDANPEVVALRRRLDEMKRQLARVPYGEDGISGRPASRDSGEFVVPLRKVPAVGIELARRIRGVKVQETLVTLLAQQAEQARLNEAKDLPTVQVLDRAVPAQRPSRPSLASNTLVAAVGSLMLGIVLAFVVEAVHNARRPSRRPLP